MAALPATALTCLWLRGTHLTRAAIGWAAKQLFGCKQGRSGPANLPTTGRRPIGFRSINSDTDLGGVSATVVDVPGATPSQLVLALGKDSNAYLVDRNNLGGITAPVAQASVVSSNRGTSAVTYHTSQGTYIAFHNDNNQVKAYKITATSPPTIVLRLEPDSGRTRLALGHNHGWNEQHDCVGSRCAG